MPELDLTSGYSKSRTGTLASDVASKVHRLLSSLDSWERKSLSDTRVADLSYMEEAATYFSISDPDMRDKIIKEITTYQDSPDRRTAHTAELMLPSFIQSNKALDQTEDMFQQVRSIEAKLGKKRDYIRTPDTQAIIENAADVAGAYSKYISGQEKFEMNEILESESELNNVANYLRYFDVDKQRPGMQFHEDLPYGYVNSITTLLDRWDKGEMTHEDFYKILEQERDEGGLGIAVQGDWKTQEDIILEGYEEEQGRDNNKAMQIMNNLSPTLNSIISAALDRDDRSFLGVGTVPMIAENREGEWDIGFAALVRNVYVLMHEWGDGSVDELLGEGEDYPITTSGQLAKLKELDDAIKAGDGVIDLRAWSLSGDAARVAMAVQTLGEVMELKKLFEKKTERGFKAREISRDAGKKSVFRLPTSEEEINPDLLRIPGTGYDANWRPEYSSLEELKEFYFDGYDITAEEALKLSEAGLLDKRVYEDMVAEQDDIIGSLTALEGDVIETSFIGDLVREIAPVRLIMQREKRKEAFARADIRIAKEKRAEDKRAEEVIELIEEEEFVGEEEKEKGPSIQFLKNERKKLIKYSKKLDWEKLEKIADAIGVEHEGIIRKDLVKILFDTIDARIESKE